MPSAASPPASRRTSAFGGSKAWRSSVIGLACWDRNAEFLEAWMARAAAAFIALVCWTGIGLQFWAGYSHNHDVIVTLWGLSRFFTIIGNLALAMVMSWAALGG